MMLIVQPLTKKPQDRTVIYRNSLVMLLVFALMVLLVVAFIRDWGEMASTPYFRLFGLTMVVILLYALGREYVLTVPRLFTPVLILDKNGITVQTSAWRKDDFFTAWRDVQEIDEIQKSRAEGGGSYIELIVNQRYMLNQILGWRITPHIAELTPIAYQFDIFYFFSNHSPTYKKLKKYHQHYKFTEPMGDVQRWYNPPKALLGEEENECENDDES